MTSCTTAAFWGGSASCADKHGLWLDPKNVKPEYPIKDTLNHYLPMKVDKVFGVKDFRIRFIDDHGVLMTVDTMVSNGRKYIRVFCTGCDPYSRRIDSAACDEIDEFILKNS